MLVNQRNAFHSWVANKTNNQQQNSSKQQRAHKHKNAVGSISKSAKLCNPRSAFCNRTEQRRPNDKVCVYNIAQNAVLSSFSNRFIEHITCITFNTPQGRTIQSDQINKRYPLELDAAFGGRQNLHTNGGFRNLIREKIIIRHNKYNFHKIIVSGYRAVVIAVVKTSVQTLWPKLWRPLSVKSSLWQTRTTVWQRFKLQWARLDSSKH